MTTVKVSLGITKNIGNYESLRLDAEFSRDYPEGADIDDAYTQAWAVVDGQIEAKLLELEAITDNKK